MAQAPLSVPLIPEDAELPPFQGRWDFIPTVGPDSMPAEVAVTPDGAVWIAGNGGILRRARGESALIVDHWADGRDGPVPVIIAHDMIVLDLERVLVSTIWREIYVAGPRGIEEISPRGIRGRFSFADLQDGRLAIGLDDRRIDNKFAATVGEMLSRNVIFVRGVERLVVAGGKLFGINDGSLVQIDPETGVIVERARYSNRSDSIDSARAMGDGRIMIATTPHYGPGGCYVVDPSAPSQAELLFEGSCYDLVALESGDVWASTSEGIYRLLGNRWQRYFSNNINGIGRAGKFAVTQTGSLWTATTFGLWRHYLHTRQRPAPELEGLSALRRDSAGRLLAGYASGAVYLKEEGAWRPILPAEEQHTYSRLPIFEGPLDGAVAILHPGGLFRLDEEGLTRTADAPTASVQTAPASFAVCPDESVFVGLAWSGTVLRLLDGRWLPDNTLHQSIGGNAISDLACDASGNLWALGTESVGLRTADGRWSETDPLPLRSNAKGNLYGALLPEANSVGVTAWGPWGYPVVVRPDGNGLTNRVIEVSAELPYVFRDALRVGRSELVLTDGGVYLWQEEELARLPLVEERLQRVVSAINARADEGSAFGFSIDLAADAALFSVMPTRYRPELAARHPIEASVDRPSAKLEFLLDGRAYPAEEGQLGIVFHPPLSRDGLTIRPDGIVTVTGLEPDLLYRYEAQFIDAAGQASKRVTGTLLFDRPFWLNPFAWAAGTILFLVSLFMLARSPVVLDLLIRRFGRRRWQVVFGTVDRRIEVYRDDEGRLRSELSATGATLNLAARSSSVFPLKRLEDLTRSMTGLALASNTPSGKQIFSDALATLSGELNSALPPELIFELQSIEENKSILLEISRDLSGLPWDMLQGRDAAPLFASSNVSRVIRTDRFARHPGLGGRLTAAIFVAESSGREQAIWRAERDRVKVAMRSAGVLDVKTPEGKEGFLSFEHWLSGSDIIHFLGHASTDRDSGGSARFWYGLELAIDAERLREALSHVAHPPALVFMNACGTLAQENDLGGAALAGLATPFLEVGSTFIGTQWPVQTAFASDLAVEFYARALPPPNSLLWRWLRRQPLDGMTFAKALADARRTLLSRGPATDPTWSAYAIFGEPTVRLSLS